MAKKKSKAVKWYKRPIMKLEQRESDDVEIVASLDSIISFFQYMNSRMEENQKVLRLMDFQREDVYHEIELGASRNASDGYRMYKLLREISESRRVIKQESARIEPICLFLKQNPSFLEALEKLKTACEKRETAVETASYSYRTTIIADTFGASSIAQANTTHSINLTKQ